MYIKVFGETPMADVEIIFPDKTLGIKPFQVRGVLCVGGAWVGARLAMVDDDQRARRGLVGHQARTLTIKGFCSWLRESTSRLNTQTHTHTHSPPHTNTHTRNTTQQTTHAP